MSIEEWDTLDDAMADKLVITDVAFVSDRKKPPPDYEVVSLDLCSLSLSLSLSPPCLWFLYINRLHVHNIKTFQVENTHDGRKANFPEGRLGLTTRYLCYSRKKVSQRVSQL